MANNNRAGQAATTNVSSASKGTIKKKKVLEKVEFLPVVSFTNQGDEFIGKIDAIRETETQYGVSDVADVTDFETGEQKSLFLTSNLKGYDWAGLIGKYVSITYIRNDKNPQTRRTYKVYEVAEVEVE